MAERDNWHTDMGTQADTYIEKRFEEECEFLANGDSVLNEWRQRKEQYISYTNTIIFDYQHFSRHDVTHSLKILESIELIIGKDRISGLSAGDLWLLLESAYFHDIGMAVTYADLTEIWTSDEFKEFLNSAEVKNDPELLESKNWYARMDELVRNRKEIYCIEYEEEVEFGDTWPLELERKLLFLVTAFIRKDHAKRCKKYLKRFSKSLNGSVPERLYQVVAEVAVSHGESFDYILEHLKYKTQGLGMDYVHPQFAAAMLRLGDLLDMDNNRFNLRALEHYGKIPWTSMLHFKKHKAMTHIMISKNRIEAEAEDENLEVCQITRNWFKYIEQEVKDLICHWSEIAPQSLSGCLMQQAVCKVYHPHAPIEFRSDWQKQFEVDKVKLTELLIGTNIYDIKLEFLREYIQNALDASKMQLWLDLKQGKHQFRCNPDIRSINRLAPFDIPQEVYDQYAIEVNVKVDIRTQKVSFEIIDHGIGMEEACLDVISKIGLGWKGRKRYSDEIPQMLPWLRPTGGFGIGIQSAFMLSDQVELLTKSDSEIESHRITLKSPKLSGIITEETGPAMEGDYFGLKQRGTTVRVDVSLDYFQQWTENNMRVEEQENKRKNTIQKLLTEHPVLKGDFFDADSTLDYVISCVDNYLKAILADSMIPIRITNPGRQSVLVKTAFGIEDSYWKKNHSLFVVTKKMQGHTYRGIYDFEKDKLSVWDENENIYFYIKRQENLLERRHMVCFKNVCVVRNTDFDFPVARDFDVCIDFMGHSAESALQIHRNSFNETFPLEEYVRTGIGIFIAVMLEISGGIENRKKNAKTLSEEQIKKWEEREQAIVENLNKSYIQLVRLLYFDNIKNFKDPLGTKISAKIYYNLDIIEEVKDGKKESMLHVENKEIDALISSLLSGVSSLINETNIQNKDQQKQLCIKCPETLEPKVIMITPDDVRKIRKDLEIEKSADYSSEYRAKIELIKNMQKKEGLCVCNDSYVYSVLLGSERLSCTHFRFETDTKEIITIALFEKKESAPIQTPLRDEEFYKRAYGKEGRTVFGLPESCEYETLMVSCLPFEMAPTETGPYLISPISQSLREQINEKTDVSAPKSGLSTPGRYQKQYSLKEFLQLVLDSDEFHALLEWVYRHQIDYGRYKKSDIRDEYRKFLEEIYNECLA